MGRFAPVHAPGGGLSDVDGLVRQLTQWCQHPLVFEVVTDPCAMADTASGDQVRCVISDMRLAPMGTEVYVPLALLLDSDPPAACRGCGQLAAVALFLVTVASTP